MGNPTWNTKTKKHLCLQSCFSESHSTPKTHYPPPPHFPTPQDTPTSFAPCFQEGWHSTLVSALGIVFWNYTTFFGTNYMQCWSRFISSASTCRNPWLQAIHLPWSFTSDFIFLWNKNSHCMMVCSLHFFLLNTVMSAKNTLLPAAFHCCWLYVYIRIYVDIYYIERYM